MHKATVYIHEMQKVTRGKHQKQTIIPLGHQHTYSCPRAAEVMPHHMAHPSPLTVLVLFCWFRVEMEFPQGAQDDQQDCEHLPSGSSFAVLDQLHHVTDLWLVQLPSSWQDVRSQHSRYSTRRQVDRHSRQQRLVLVQHRVHRSGLISIVNDERLSQSYTVIQVVV